MFWKWKLRRIRDSRGDYCKGCLCSPIFLGGVFSPAKVKKI